MRIHPKQHIIQSNKVNNNPIFIGDDTNFIIP